MFSILLGFGSTLGLWRTTLFLPYPLARSRIDAGLIALLGCLVGARFGFVVAHIPYFRHNHLLAFLIGQGGLSWPGTVLGAFLALALWSALRHQNLFNLLEDTASLWAPLAVMAWLGCWASGSAYGPVAPAGTVWAIPTLDETGQVLMRFPLQLFAAFSLLAGSLLLDLARPGGSHSRLLARLNMVFLFAHILLFLSWRAQPIPTWQGLPQDVWAAGVFLSLAVMWSAAALLPRRKALPAWPQLYPDNEANPDA